MNFELKNKSQWKLENIVYWIIKKNSKTCRMLLKYRLKGKCVALNACNSAKRF